MHHTLNDTFNISNDRVEKVTGDVITQTGEVIVPQSSDIVKNADYDYERTRNNLHTLLAQGQEALTHALEVAKSSEHPRAFEVVGNLVKQMADVNHQLLDLTEKRQKLSEKNATETTQITNNNAFFVGSTMDLSKMIKGMIDN